MTVKSTYSVDIADSSMSTGDEIWKWYRYECTIEWDDLGDDDRVFTLHARFRWETKDYGQFRRMLSTLAWVGAKAM